MGKEESLDGVVSGLRELASLAADAGYFHEKKARELKRNFDEAGIPVSEVPCVEVCRSIINKTLGHKPYFNSGDVGGITKVCGEIEVYRDRLRR